MHLPEDEAGALLLIILAVIAVAVLVFLALCVIPSALLGWAIGGRFADAAPTRRRLLWRWLGMLAGPVVGAAVSAGACWLVTALPLGDLAGPATLPALVAGPGALCLVLGAMRRSAPAAVPADAVYGAYGHGIAQGVGGRGAAAPPPQFYA